MVRDCPLFVRGKDEGFLLEAADNTLDGLLKVLYFNAVGVISCSYTCVRD